MQAQPKTDDLALVVEELRRRDAFVMVSHVKPDGDTLGAGLALGLALKQLGKRVAYFQQDPVPRNLRFRPDSERVARALPAGLPPDTLFVFCDMSDPARAGEFLPPLQRENMLDIDHHLGNAHFGAYNLVIPEETSTGTVVVRILRALGIPIDARIATCILTTIMTDTGGFMHSNTTPQTLELSAELMRAGADKERITDEIFGNKRIAAIRLLGEVLAVMRFSSEGRYCYSYIDEPMLARTGADGEDSEDLVNVLLRVEGVHAAALFKAFDGEIRVSLRSDGSVNVQQAAAQLGGGGHYRASGLTHPGPLPEAFAAVETALLHEGLATTALA